MEVFGLETGGELRSMTHCGGGGGATVVFVMFTLVIVVVMFWPGLRGVVNSDG